MEKLRVVLDWFPNAIHTGMLLADRKGYFADEGLEVEIGGEVHGVMGLHGADFVCGPECSMLDLRKMGVDITGIAALTQKCDSGIVSLKEAGIERPRDLTGKRLSHWAPDWYHTVVGYCVNQDGGDYSKVSLVQEDVGDIVASLGNEVDAVWVYENYECYLLEDTGREINYFNFGDYQPFMDFAAPAMAATHEVLTQRPEAVKGFMRALDRGYQDTVKDPEGSILAVKDKMPDVCSEEMLVKSILHLAPIFLDKNGHWGTIRPFRWEGMADFMVKQGAIPHRFDHEWTNDFVAEGHEEF